MVNLNPDYQRLMGIYPLEGMFFRNPRLIMTTMTENGSYKQEARETRLLKEGSLLSTTAARWWERSWPDRWRIDVDG